MAVVIGESGAWAKVKQAFKEKRLEVSTPADLPPSLNELQLRHEQGLPPLYEAFDRMLAENEAGLAAAQADLSSEMAQRTKPLLEEAREIERTLEQYRLHSWLRRITILMVPTLRLLSRKKRIYANKEKIFASMHSELVFRQQRQDHLKLNRTQIVTNSYQEYADQITFVEQILHSSDYIGAKGELEVLEYLRKLPGTYQIHCDLNLKAHRSIRFAGEYLQTAQIDYLVVGPTGVFVVEVKNWGRQIIAQRKYYDPFEQIGRHSYLCYDLLKTYCVNIRVRSIIVKCGLLPPSAGQDYHAQVVTLPQLLGCLTRHRGQTLNAGAINQIVTTLNGFKQAGNVHSSRPDTHPRRRKMLRRRHC